VNYLRHVRENPPERAVSSRTGKNVIGHYPSLKMGHTVQTESHTGERMMAIDLEYSAVVKEFWDQPQAIQVSRTRSDGRTYRGAYTADYLTIEDGGAFVYEVKPLKALEALANEYPRDWVRTESGFEFLPAKEVFGTLGIRHVVKCAAAFNPIRMENLALMMRSRSSSVLTEVNPKLIRRIERELGICATQKLSDLMRRIGLVDVTPIIILIDQKYLFTNLNRYRLSDADSVWVSKSEDAISAIDSTVDGIKQFSQGELFEKDLPKASELARISSRLKALEKPEESNKSATTIWRLKKLLESGGSSPFALMSKYANCGRSGSRLDPRHESLIKDVIQRYYFNGQNLSKVATFNIYVHDFLRQQNEGGAGIVGKPVVFESFRRRIDGLNQEELARARQGKRAANAAAAPTDPLNRALRPLRAFERAHLDHWLCDIFVIVRRDAKTTYAVRPWVSFLIDEATGALLAFTLSLNAPSRRTCARVLRDCVRRHGRLPESIVADAGADFRSNFYHEFLASAIVEKIQRPVAAGRWGAPVERAFGKFTTEVIRGLPGNIRAIKEDRATTREFRSDQQAAIEPVMLHEIFESFAASWFNAFSSGANTVAPCIRMRESLERYSLSGVEKKLDLAFMVGTSIILERSTFEVDPQRGIRAQERHYVPSALAMRRSQRIEELRVDPENINVVYALCNEKWHAAYSGSLTSTLATNHVNTLYTTLSEIECQGASRAADIQKRATIGGLLQDVQRYVDKREEAIEAAEIVIEIPKLPSSDIQRYLKSARPMISGE